MSRRPEINDRCRPYYRAGGAASGSRPPLRRVAQAGRARSALALLLLATSFSPTSAAVPRTLEATLEIDLPVARGDSTAGSLIAADLDGDDQPDFVVTQPGHVFATSVSGRTLWSHQVPVQVTGQSERDGLPGHHGPGVQAADVNGDGRTEVLYLTRAGTLRIATGATGRIIAELPVASPKGTRRWEHLAVADFRGLGPHDLLLQATNRDGYRVGRFIAAYRIEDLLSGRPAEPMWQRDDFLSAAHNGARIADVDDDGRDEVIGGEIIEEDGSEGASATIRGHVDAVQIADIVPARPGLEVVVLEEGGRWPQGDGRIARWLDWQINKIRPTGNRVILLGTDGVLWARGYKHREPQNALVGRFLPEDRSLQIWNRSRYDRNQRPFVFDAQGDLVARYELADQAPSDWTRAGLEVIHPIHWTGTGIQHGAAKERHKAGDVTIFDPMTGEFVVRIDETADRLYVADVLGDWREELIVLSGRHLRIYTNPDPNPNPGHPRLWAQAHYPKLKQNWNYYSP